MLVVMIIILPFQICVSGVSGAPGQPAPSLAAVESGSATDARWPLLQELAARASRHRARAATQDSAQVGGVHSTTLTHSYTFTNMKKKGEIVIFFVSQVSAVRTGGGSTRRAAPISVLAAALTYGSMCSVSKEPVIQVKTF